MSTMILHDRCFHKINSKEINKNSTMLQHGVLRQVCD